MKRHRRRWRYDPAYDATFAALRRLWHPAVAAIEAHLYRARVAVQARRRGPA